MSGDPAAATARSDNGRDGLLYVALGDSFTAGPGCSPEERWPDRLAAWLRGAYSPFRYENLAADGATSEDVLDQVDSALELRPGLVTMICGANDVLKLVRPDIEAYTARLTTILDRLRGALPRAAIVTATNPEYWRFADRRGSHAARQLRDRGLPGRGRAMTRPGVEATAATAARMTRPGVEATAATAARMTPPGVAAPAAPQAPGPAVGIDGPRL